MSGVIETTRTLNFLIELVCVLRGRAVGSDSQGQVLTTDCTQGSFLMVLGELYLGPRIKSEMVT